MSEKNTVKTASGIRRYHSKKPGVRLALPEKFSHDKKEYKIDDLAKMLSGKFSIPFPQKNPYFETDEPVLIALIEGDKQFKIGNIIRVTTEEERQVLKLEQAQTDYLRVQKQSLADGLFELEKLSLDSLQAIAEKGGVPAVSGEGKALTKPLLIKELEEALKSV